MDKLPEQGMGIMRKVAGHIWGWYQDLDKGSNIKQVLSEERIAAAKGFAKRGTEVAQQVLEDERVNTAKEYAGQVAHDVAGSVSEWYQELEPGYFSKWAQIFMKMMAKCSVVFQEIVIWSSTPQAAKLFGIWVSVFFGVFIFLNLLGFRKTGVAAGSIAAGWQSFAYGAFTPLGGAFAFLTSMAMLGRFQPFASSAGALVSTCVTVICFLNGVGK